MPARRLLCLALLAACGAGPPPPSRPAAPSPAMHLDPIPVPGPDPHSYARPGEVLVRHLGLDLAVDFDARALTGAATLLLARAPGAGELVLDTRDLEILDVSVATAGDLPTPPRLAAIDRPWRPAAWRLGGAHPLLGRPLRIALPDAADLVRVRYRTRPEATGLQWLAPEQTHDRAAPFLYSQSQSIHARSWIPVQDSPGVRLTFDARVVAPAPTRPVMAAEHLAPETGPEGQVVHRFALDRPIPAYLLALAVGRLDAARTGPRTGVWAEPGLLAAARSEFADLEAMLTATEASFGAYRWGTYDVLVLPPAFPFGGMENPLVTFVTPTILAGDRSLVSLIAHELAHSWSGNLVTNATWGDLWLNEGFTVYLERRIVEAVYGPARAELEAELAYQRLGDEIAALAARPEEQLLQRDLAGRDPDEAATDIAYEKGYLFLRRLEQAYGRPAFDGFLRAWFDRHAFTSRSTADLRAFLQHELIATTSLQPDQTAPDLGQWLTAPGLPLDAPRAVAPELAAVAEAAAAAVRGQLPDSKRVAAWSPWHWIHFLRALPLAPANARAVLADLDAAHRLTAATNHEVLAEWLTLAAAHGHPGAADRTRRFLLDVGRRKYLVPLYAALLKTPAGGRLARDIYPQARPGYHAITRATLDALLAWPKDQPTSGTAAP